MARVVVTVMAPVPPSPSSIAPAAARVARLLRRSLRRPYRVRVLWPVPEDVDAVLGTADLAVHVISPDPEDGDGYRAAVDHPGLVVLPDLDLRPVIEELVRARDPVGRVALAEAEASVAEPVWFAHAARRARGVVVQDEETARRLRDAGSRTPVFVVPFDDRGAAPLAGAVRSTLALVADPAETAIGRWAAALSDVGIGQDELIAEGYGLRYAEALDELRRSPAGEPARG
ncbi:MAG TPA: hypothetical protein VHH92_05385 [Actinomycetota bacterium]|nr:hypothetical protein [Actinomycetota bacterium]